MAGLLGKHPRRLHVEPLEDRRMLAVATVDTELDVVDFADGVTSLREAIFAANILSGADTIEFDPSMAGKTILLTQGELQITDDLTINGLGAELLTIDAGNGTDGVFATGDGTRIFRVDDGDIATDLEVAIKGLSLTGGDSSLGGGAIDNRENLLIESSTISGNAAASGGGSIASQGGELTIRHSTINNNYSSVSGGGISTFESILTIDSSTIDRNESNSSGGGITNQSSNTTINNTLIVDNIANRHGGGISNRGRGYTTEITNSTITGNTAVTQGGGAVAEYSGTTTIAHSTVTHNAASLGGSLKAVIDNYVTTFVLKHSIVANSVDLAGQPTSDLVMPSFGVADYFADFSLIEDPSTVSLIGANNITGQDPLLAPLANNGGPTQTHALLVGSPATDAGDPSFVGPPNYDQRGFAYNRVVEGRIDIGAFEYGAVSADFDEDGGVDGFDFLAWQRGFGTPAPLAEKSDGDADDDMDVDSDDLAAWENAYGANGVAPLLAGFAVVGDDTARFEPRAVRSPATAPFSHAQLVDLALAVYLNGSFTVAANPSPSPSLQERGTDGTHQSREEAFATLDVSPWQDEDAAVVLAGEHRLGLAGDVAESDFADQGLQTLEDVPLSGEFFPDL